MKTISRIIGGISRIARMDQADEVVVKPIFILFVVWCLLIASIVWLYFSAATH